MYTPILKRITLIKNISCASLVSFSLFFSALASSQSTMLLSNKNFGLLSITMGYIFFGSLSNELLLLKVQNFLSNGVFNSDKTKFTFEMSPFSANFIAS